MRLVCLMCVWGCAHAHTFANVTFMHISYSRPNVEYPKALLKFTLYFYQYVWWPCLLKRCVSIMVEFLGVV